MTQAKEKSCWDEVREAGNTTSELKNSDRQINDKVLEMYSCRKEVADRLVAKMSVPRSGALQMAFWGWVFAQKEKGSEARLICSCSQMFAVLWLFFPDLWSSWSLDQLYSQIIVYVMQREKVDSLLLRFSSQQYGLLQIINQKFLSKIEALLWPSWICSSDLGKQWSC